MSKLFQNLKNKLFKKNKNTSVKSPLIPEEKSFIYEEWPLCKDITFIIFDKLFKICYTDIPSIIRDYYFKIEWGQDTTRFDCGKDHIKYLEDDFEIRRIYKMGSGFAALTPLVSSFFKIWVKMRDEEFILHYSNFNGANNMGIVIKTAAIFSKAAAYDTYIFFCRLHSNKYNNEKMYFSEITRGINVKASRENNLMTLCVEMKDENNMMIRAERNIEFLGKDDFIKYNIVPLNKSEEENNKKLDETIKSKLLFLLTKMPGTLAYSVLGNCNLLKSMLYEIFEGWNYKDEVVKYYDNSGRFIKSRDFSAAQITKFSYSDDVIYDENEIFLSNFLRKNINVKKQKMYYLIVSPRSLEVKLLEKIYKDTNNSKVFISYSYKRKIVYVINTEVDAKIPYKTLEMYFDDEDEKVKYLFDDKSIENTEKYYYNKNASRSKKCLLQLLNKEIN